MDKVRDVFVSTGTSTSGAAQAQAVLTFKDKPSAIAVYEVAKTWFFYAEQEGVGSRKLFHNVKWWETNFRLSRPASGYGRSCAPAGSSPS
jgi:hypothetical protein